MPAYFGGFFVTLLKLGAQAFDASKSRGERIEGVASIAAISLILGLAAHRKSLISLPMPLFWAGIVAFVTAILIIVVAQMFIRRTGTA